MNQIPIISIEDLRVIKEIGKGNFGTVYLVENIKEKTEYAAKETNSYDSSDENTFFIEITVYSKTNNPAILIFLGYNLQNFHYQPFPIMITEFMSNGSLDQMIIKERRGLAPHNYTITKKYIILLGIAIGMKYLHSLGIIHRDLKPANILLDDELNPRICDFGCSFISDEQLNKIKMESEVGTPMYMAPEIISGDCYTYKVDVYSFSFLFYELITCKKPFEGYTSVFRLLNDVKKGKRPDLSLIKEKKIRNFLSKSWSENPTERPTFSQIVEEMMEDEFKKSFGFIDDYEVEDYIDLFDKKLLDPDLNHDINIQELAIKGNPQEMGMHGLMLLRGIGVKPNKKEAAKYLKYAADKGDIQSMVLYGIMLNNGDGIEIDRKEAARYFKMAIDKGDHQAMFSYAMMVDQGKGVKMNKEEANKYYKMLIDKGNHNAMYVYGNNLYHGYGIKENKKEAAKYFKLSANEGCPDAMLNYGWMLLYGEEIQKDMIEGIRYVKMAVDSGLKKAVTFYEKLKKEGIVDFVNNLENVKKLAESGDTDAMLGYGEMLLMDEGIEKDINQAIFYIKKSADQGNKDAILFYAVLRLKGDKIPKDKKEAIKYLKIASNRGIAEASNLLTMISLGGADSTDDEIDEKDYDQDDDDKDDECEDRDDDENDVENDLFEFGVFLIEKNAEKGEPEAMLRYGQMLIHGFNGEKNIKKGLEFIKKAADKGEIEAMYEYANCGFNGIGMKQNYKIAARYYKIAAEKGHVDAMKSYGIMLLNGLGVKKNMNEGKRFIELAAKQK